MYYFLLIFFRGIIVSTNLVKVLNIDIFVELLDLLFTLHNSLGAILSRKGVCKTREKGSGV
jgi:hypothetical protein